MLLMQTEDLDSDSSGDELTTYVNRDGTQSSATVAELKLAAELSKDPWGRFGGRAGKMARIRAQEAETLAAMQVCGWHQTCFHTASGRPCRCLGVYSTMSASKRHFERQIRHVCNTCIIELTDTPRLKGMCARQWGWPCSVCSMYVI